MGFNFILYLWFFSLLHISFCRWVAEIQGERASAAPLWWGRPFSKQLCAGEIHTEQSFLPARKEAHLQGPAALGEAKGQAQKSRSADLESQGDSGLSFRPERTGKLGTMSLSQRTGSNWKAPRPVGSVPYKSHQPLRRLKRKNLNLYQ